MGRASDFVGIRFRGIPLGVTLLGRAKPTFVSVAMHRGVQNRALVGMLYRNEMSRADQDWLNIFLIQNVDFRNGPLFVKCSK